MRPDPNVPLSYHPFPTDDLSFLLGAPHLFAPSYLSTPHPLDHGPIPVGFDRSCSPIDVMSKRVGVGPLRCPMFHGRAAATVFSRRHSLLRRRSAADRCALHRLSGAQRRRGHVPLSPSGGEPGWELAGVLRSTTSAADRVPLPRYDHAGDSAPCRALWPLPLPARDRILRLDRGRPTQLHATLEGAQHLDGACHASRIRRGRSGATPAQNVAIHGGRTGSHQWTRQTVHVHQLPATSSVSRPDYIRSCPTRHVSFSRPHRPLPPRLQPSTLPCRLLSRHSSGIGYSLAHPWARVSRRADAEISLTARTGSARGLLAHLSPTSYAAHLSLPLPSCYERHAN
ncbi:hypothetical protein V8E36_009722 [Tilletia maclaganii]